MNVWGKIALFLIIVGGIAGAVLSSKSFDVRNTWAKELDSLNKQNLDNSERLKNERSRNQQLQAEYQRLRPAFGTYWTDIETQVVDRGEGIIRVNGLGTNQGLVVSEDGTPTIIYGFQPANNNKYMYIGGFIVTQIGESAAELKALWKVRPNEVSLWEDGNWRWRSTFPESLTSTIDNLHNQLLEADEFAVAQANNLELQNQLLKEAENQLNLRNEELLANEGLIQSLEKESQNRDLSLKQLDDLRIQLKKSVEKRDTLIEEIKQLKTKLPKTGKTAVPTKVSRKNNP